ncbi:MULTISPECIES: flagellar biosynthesis repressor FlbT [Methylosinus]|uniref:Flagellar biosynthesis repressor FlbT n=1 Tax=Methylosinus trichosporium (strain ATCC 35070 / NCIMB 11131 / UNIQEM 75 / OB3b) TaxID=595536 RepID=A0A2D2D4C7_METT3|nr:MULTISPECIES: flagellar biosynthesis repressor FlbT [Methylosinus]ATQ69858.1 flagellar biosynthesis repressor FlbT [Methylosinus trichosporium OB3b]OBS54493.1 flagellar biosynthesis repressor FlbT [Methylosinus sp. 3S-1]
MNISLRRGEKLYLNGAVIRADRKVCIELLNDVTFLLENHVMQAQEATTPLRQLYFVIQLMLMAPNDTANAMEMCRSMLASLNLAFVEPRILSGLTLVARHIEAKKLFDALKTIRALFALEQEILNAASVRGDDKAA